MAIVAGCDEVGWGALAGPVVSVVAVFKESDFAFLPKGVRDSKKTTEDERRAMYHPILMAAHDVGIGWAWPNELDEAPNRALQLSYRRALENLSPRHLPDILYMDGIKPVQYWGGRQVVEPRADSRYPQVSAASIVAKVYRDQVMREYARIYPQYKFDEGKGYCTATHKAAILEHGIVRGIHRERWCRKLTK